MRLSAQPQLELLGSGSWCTSSRGRPLASWPLFRTTLRLLEFPLDCGHISIQRSPQQARLRSIELLGGARKAQPLVARRLVGDLFDARALEQQLALECGDRPALSLFWCCCSLKHSMSSRTAHAAAPVESLSSEGFTMRLHQDRIITCRLSPLSAGVLPNPFTPTQMHFACRSAAMAVRSPLP